MKKIESKSLIYTQKDVTVGNNRRSIITITKNPDHKTSDKNVKSATVRKKTCGGCSRKRRKV